MRRAYYVKHACMRANHLYRAIMSQSTHIDEGRWEGVREVMAMSWPIILGSLSLHGDGFLGQVYGRLAG
jgi:hypothetical protein